MRADLVKLMTPEIKGGLIAADAAGFQLAPHIEMHALMSRVILGTAGPAALQTDTQRAVHQTESWLKPSRPLEEAKGVPLSLRIASGKP